MKNLILLICIIACSAVYAAPKKKPSSIEPVKVYIAPILNHAQLNALPEWPTDRRTENAVLKKIAEIRKTMRSTLMSSNCANSVVVVEDSQQPSIRVSITLKSVTLTNNTLEIPLQVEIEHIPDGTIKSYMMSSSVTVSKPASDHKKPFIIRLFTEYHDRFPYTSIISAFCTY